MARHPQSPEDGIRVSAGSTSRPGPWNSFSSSRVSEARYDSGLEQIHVIFRDGTPWTYDNVPQNIWRQFRRSASPGSYINRVLNAYPYWQGGFSHSEDMGSDRDDLPWT